MIATDGRQTIANATGPGGGGAMLAPSKRKAPRPIVDNLTYGVLVESVPGQGRVVRDRWPYLDRPRQQVVRKIVRYHADRGNRMEWRQGKTGAEKLVMYAEDGIILAIDGSGVPAYYGRVAAYTEDES